MHDARIKTDRQPKGSLAQSYIQCRPRDRHRAPLGYKVEQVQIRGLIGAKVAYPDSCGGDCRGTLPERVRNGRIECNGSLMSHGDLHGSASLQRPLPKDGAVPLEFPRSLDLRADFK